MSVYKDKNNKWRVVYRYTDWMGSTKQTQKRGFETKREAVAWEKEQMLKLNCSLDMSFEKFSELYFEDLGKRIRESTLATKRSTFNKHLLPYFGQKCMRDILPRDIIAWQNNMLEYRDESTGAPFSPVYLKTVHNQLSALFNHAVKYYGLPKNPAAVVGNMGKAKNGEKQVWTKDEYQKFAEAIMDKPLSFYAFEILYWCGIREGELLALTPADIDLEAGTLTVNKSYQYVNGRGVITPPKTEKSNRTISMPDFLVEELRDLLRSIYGIEPHERIFDFSKSYLHHEMDRGSKAAGVKRIRIHDLRHSHVSLLFSMGFNAVEIGNRVGHESIEITYGYAHMFPSRQAEMASRLSTERKELEENVAKES